MRDVRAQAALHRELGLDLVETPRLALGNAQNDLTTQCGGAVVDVIEPWVVLPFFVAIDPRVALLVGAHTRVARVPFALVFEDRHHPVDVTMLFERPERTGVVERQVAVPVGHEKMRGKLVRGAPERPRRPEQPVNLVGVANVDPEGASIADRGPDLLAEMG